MSSGEKISRLLGEIEPGDKIKIETKEQSFEGILMPRPEIADQKHIVVKMENGYNIGISAQNIKNIELESKGEEFKYEPEKTQEIMVDESLPTVSLLGCGGTISSRIEYRTGAVYPSFSPKDLVDFVPELKQIANIRGRKLFDLFSEDMTPHHWIQIAKACKEEIGKGTDGIIITQGTDTMHYTAAALSFMLQDLPVPVVLTGAQRSSDRGSCDSPMNLVCSFKAACSKIAEVMVCMHGETDDTYCLAHPGTKVRKLHTSRRDAFETVNGDPYAKIWYKKNEIKHLREDFNERNEERELKVEADLNPDVGLIYIHPGMKPELVESLSDHYDGIVLAGTGLGHVPANKVDEYTKPILPAIEKLIENDIPVVMSPQTIYGRLQMNVYSTGRDLLKAGVIGNHCDWTPETALVKLMWALGKTEEMDRIKELMETNIAGEISERSKIT